MALGPLECHWEGRPLALGGGKQQMVLALLVLEANKVVSVDRLIEWVWPGDPELRNAATLQVYVSNLRRLLAPAAAALERSLVVTRRPGYELQLRAEESDILRLEALRELGVAARARGDIATAVEHFREALGLWRGEPLSGLPVDVVGGGVLARLHAIRLSLFEQTVECELAQGRHLEVVQQLGEWVASNPLDERLRGHLMLAAYRCGRQAEALAIYREGRNLLVEELGIEPSRELRELERRILDQDPALDLPRIDAPLRHEVGSTQLRASVLGPAAALEIGDSVVELDRQVTTIGRLPDRDIVLDDIGVSRVHAEVRRSGHGFTIFDVGSANGVVVNGERVDQHRLADGDTIRLGDVEITFRTLSS